MFPLISFVRKFYRLTIDFIDQFMTSFGSHKNSSLRISVPQNTIIVSALTCHYAGTKSRAYLTVVSGGVTPKVLHELLCKIFFGK